MVRVSRCLHTRCTETSETGGPRHDGSSVPSRGDRRRRFRRAGSDLRLEGAPVSITLVDRRNHHLFQPLLYQVATASLATSEIAWPIRYLLRDRPDVTTLFATVTGVDTASKRVLLEDGDALPYDTLVLATGAGTPISAMTNGSRSRPA